MISLNVEYKIFRNIESTRKIILNINKYKNWWNNFNTKVINNTIIFSPFPFTTVELQPVKIESNSIKLKYTKAPFVGFGTWTLTSSGPQTLVSYSIDIEGKKCFINFLIKTPVFKYKHRRDIIKLIKKLEWI